MIDKRWSRTLIIVTLVGIISIFYYNAIAHFGYTPDDTYIYLQYAKNVIAGNGVSFNAGDPTYGITSPLWLFIISFGGKLGIDLPLAAKSIDLFFACLALILFYVVAFELLKDTAVALCATIAFSLNVWLLRWAGTGMETSLAVFLLLLTFKYVLSKRYFPAVTFVALLSLVRPEAWILFVLIVVEILRNAKDAPTGVKIVLRLLFLYGAVVLPWLVYAYTMFGTIIPNTAFAKATIGFTIDDGYSTLKDIAQSVVFSDGAAIFLLLISGGILVARKVRTIRETDGHSGQSRIFSPLFVGIGFIVLLPLFYIITGVNIVSRYLLLITPLILLYAFYFINQIISPGKLHRFGYVLVLIITTLLMFQNQFVYGRYVRPGIKSFEHGMDLCLIPIGKWLKMHTPPGSKIFAQDVGALGYYSERTICDAAGLISPTMLSLLRQGYTHARMMDEKIYDLPCSCDYVVYRSFAPEDCAVSGSLIPIFFKPFLQMGLAETRMNYYTVYEVYHGFSINNGKGN